MTKVEVSSLDVSGKVRASKSNKGGPIVTLSENDGNLTQNSLTSSILHKRKNRSPSAGRTGLRHRVVGAEGQKGLGLNLASPPCKD